jgi:SAM-dependent methyltransferase
VLTFDFDRLDVRAGMRVLDVGAGSGRHTDEAYRRGADVVALDLSHDALRETNERLRGDHDARVGSGAALSVRADVLALPFPDASFDRVIASEVLEHVPADRAAMAELVRVLRPGGLAAVTVPRWLPEKVCWALSDAYHQVDGGHVRIYRGTELRQRLTDAGLEVLGGAHAHALHSPYWWVRCAVGPHNDDHPATRLYHRLLVWDMMARPRLTRVTERLLNPLIGKSLVLYARKPAILAGTSEPASAAA